MNTPASLHAIELRVNVPGYHLDKPFTYSAPSTCAIGDVVTVDFRGKRVEGFVTANLGPVSACQRDYAIKPVRAIQGRMFDPIDVPIWQAIADTYASTFAHVARAAIPAIVQRVRGEVATWAHDLTTDQLLATVPLRQLLARGTYAPMHPVLEVLGKAYRHAVLERTMTEVDGQEDPIVHTVLAACAQGWQVSILAHDWTHPVLTRLHAIAQPLISHVGGAVQEADDYRAFLRWRLGYSRILIGPSRCALWPGSPGKVGLIVCLDEANPAYKQAKGAKYHAVLASALRAQHLGVPLVTTDAVPSAWAVGQVLEDAALVVGPPPSLVHDASPRIRLVEPQYIPANERRGRLYDQTRQAIIRTLEAGESVIVLAAMRGAGRGLVCKRCAKMARCPVCSGALHPEHNTQHDERWVCLGCGHSQGASGCPEGCESAMSVLGAGVATLGKELGKLVEGVEVCVMEGYDQPGPPGERPAMAIMTRGSIVHAPAWLARRGGRAGLLVCADPDVLMVASAVDTNERTMRLLMQAASLAREVLVQTSMGDHHIMTSLMRRSSSWFWDKELEHRQGLGAPPAWRWILARQVSPDQATALRGVLQAVGERLSVERPVSQSALGLQDTLGAYLASSTDELAHPPSAQATPGAEPVSGGVASALPASEVTLGGVASALPASEVTPGGVASALPASESEGEIAPAEPPLSLAELDPLGILGLAEQAKGNPMTIMGPDASKRLVILYPSTWHTDIVHAMHPLRLAWAQANEAIRVEVDPLELPTSTA